ncbi:hypothetical protein ACF0H5_019703 [Mactra antiquata]
MDKLRQAASKAIDEAAEGLQEISNKIWACPEENFEEVEAHNNITNYLADNGFEVERSYLLKTGFRSVFGEGSPHVAVLCEYDALPEIGHACGHNLIAEVGLAAGIGIRAAMNASGTPLGKFSIIGTPAEEGGGGKIDMITAGCFKDIDVALMAHPSPYNSEMLECLAIELVTVIYHGKAAHASAFPWDGVNALDAAVLCYQNVSCLRQQFKPTWRVHGIIEKGGTKPNIIPDYTQMEFYARTPKRDELVVLKKMLENCFKSAAQSTGCTVEIKWNGRPYYDMNNIKFLNDIYRTNALNIGVDFDTHGTSKYDGNAPAGSTDMGNVSYQVPSIHPMFYIGTEAVNHTKEFTVAAGSVEAQPYTLKVAKAVAFTAIDVMTKPDVLKKIKEDFKKKTMDKE